MMAPDTVLDDDDTIRKRTEEGLRPLAPGRRRCSSVGPGRWSWRRGPAPSTSASTGRLNAGWPGRHRTSTLELDATKRRQGEADKARSQFVKRLFRVDPADSRLYHLVLDPTVLGIEASVRVVQPAAEAFFDANPAT